MFHFDGYYRGSTWAFFGVTNRDLFADDKNSLLEYLPSIVERLVDKFYLFGSEAEYPCYRAGEKIVLRTNVANFGRKSRTCAIRFQVISAKDKRTILLERAAETAVAPGETKPIEVEWTAPQKGEDFFIVRCTLMAANAAGPRKTGKKNIIDEEKNAFIVWRDDLVRRGPRIAIGDRYFTFNGKTRYLIGCQNWWGTTGSISQRNVLDWERDFQMMQDLGLHFSRCFLPWRTEREKRTSDAWVYLAQKHGIVMFHAPNLFATADPEQFQQEIAAAKEIAARYRDVPGFLIDTCNETGIADVIVNLTQENVVVASTITNASGYYEFTDVMPGSYYVNASKLRFWDNSTAVTVTEGATTTADMMLWLKGDLNNNGISADAGDLVLMKRASVGEISGDWKYDLNNNDMIADAGDLVLMKRASVGEIVLI